MWWGLAAGLLARSAAAQVAPADASGTQPGERAAGASAPAAAPGATQGNAAPLASPAATQGNAAPGATQGNVAPPATGRAQDAAERELAAPPPPSIEAAPHAAPDPDLADEPGDVAHQGRGHGRGRNHGRGHGHAVVAAQPDGADMPARGARPVEPVAESGVVVRAGGARDRTATEFNIPLATLSLVPRTNASDLLTLAPGVSVSNDAGEAHAQHIFLRGFAGEDGRDTALSVDGVPLNDESNPEANGYTDLYMLIPELVERLDVTQGVSDPRQGNFAVAGSIDYHLGLRERGTQARASVGMFGYRRLVGLWGPGHNSQTFLGLETTHTDGFGPRRDMDRVSAMGQYAFTLGTGLTGRLFAGVYHSRFSSPGLVREDDVASGQVDFYGSYAAARGQGGYSSRAMVVGALDYRTTHDRLELRLWGQLRDYGLNENFEGFYEHPDEGDLLRHGYTGGTVGLNGYYRYTLTWLGRAQEFEVGWSARHDRYTATLQHIDSNTLLQATPTEEDATADLSATHLSAYGDITFRPLSWLTARGGARVDLMGYDVDSNTYDEDDMHFERGHHASWAALVNPKATLDFSLGGGVVLMASFGTGFRSPGALDFVWAGGEQHFTTANTVEAGLRYALPRITGSQVRMQAALAAFHTIVNEDEVFDPVSGTTVSIGDTRRIGGVAWLRIQPFTWLDINVSGTYTHATTDRDVPDVMIRAGAALPYLPAFIGRLDAAADAPVGTFHGETVRLRGGLGASLRSEIPMISTNVGPATFVVDGSAGIRVGRVGFDLAVRNLLDTRWRNAVFEYASNFVPGATPSPVPVQHFTAGTPFNLYGTLSLYY